MSSAALAALVMSGGAAAQTIAQEDPPAAQGEVVVTGSRIVRDGFDAPTPVTVLSAADLAARSDINVADGLNLLPQINTSVTPSSQPTAISGGAIGVNLLSLRGLGPTRTLVLQDGKRVINTSFNTAAAAPDINHIPQNLIQRVDVVTGGASAVYGSDALAGVVNFVLDRDFTGVKGEATGGVTTYGDNGGWDVSLAAGAKFGPEGRGHVLLSGQYAGNRGVGGNDRPWNPGGGAVYVNPAYTAANGQPFYLIGDRIGSSNATPGGIVTAGPLRGTYFGQGGAVGTFNFGTVSTNNAMQGGDYQISRLDNVFNLVARDRRHVLFGRASYELAEALNLYVEGQWSRSVDSTLTLPYRRQGNLTIRGDNAFIPASVQQRLAAAGLTSLTLGTTTGDIGQIRVRNTRELTRWAVGGDGRFDIGEGTWRWDAYYQRSRNEIESTAGNNVIVARFLQATDAVRSPAGTIVCRSTLTSPADGCVPFNVFGQGVNSAAAVNYVTGTAIRNDVLKQNVAAANLTGSPVSTWAGPVSIALGIEHRFESVSGLASPTDEANGFAAGNYHASFGSYKVTEGYVEADVPLLRDSALGKSLDVSGAVRRTDYSTSGGVTTWKLGVVYAPIADIRFRATRSRDIRAPNLGELFSAGQSASGANVIDRLNGNQTNSTFIALRRGNPLLQPEVADTLGLGVVLTPSFLPGLQASIDYFDIDIDDAVKIPNEQTVIDLCAAGDQAACAFITRNAAGQITIIATPPANYLSQDARGIDGEIAYRLPLAGAADGPAITLRALGSYLISLKNVDNIATSQGAGVTGDFGGIVASGPYAPKFRSNVTLAYDDARFTAGVTWRYIAPAKLNKLLTECTSACPAGNALTISDNSIRSSSLFDLSLRFRPVASKPRAEFFLAVDNVFNAVPPFVPGRVDIGFYSGQYGYYYDRIGRTFRSGFRFAY
ncbi:TonB-dependent receptor domain-containing protein [Sphingomonas jatrophae]|nr:TonB-dependent receptor [Sphingomonas jatrophae]